MADKPKLEDLTPFGKCIIDLYVYNSERQRLYDETPFRPGTSPVKINEELSRQMQSAPMLAHIANKREFYLMMGDIRGIVMTLDQRNPKTNTRTYPGHEALDSCEKFHRPIGELYNAVIRPDRAAKFR